MLPPVIAIMGPTASGKTDLAMALHERLDAEIISVDSALVYRGMDIGTAKPNAAELRRAPHRLIDIVDPDVAYSAGQFRRDALAAIDEINQAGRSVILAGGTMLYFRALLSGIDALPEADPEIRAQLDKRGEVEGWPALHGELAQVDAAAAQRIHPNDAQRIQRALEVFEISGRPLSHWQQRRAPGLERDVLKVGLIPTQRALLHERIEQRFDAMLAAGFIEEVRGLLANYDLTPDHPAMRAVGYRQIAYYLNDQTDLAQARADAITATRRLARRQLTWLRREADLQVFESEAPNVREIAVDWLQKRGVALRGL